LASTTLADTEIKPRLTESEILELAGRLREPAELTTLRWHALSRYLQAPMPDAVQHLWRYTDAASLLPNGELVIGGPVVSDAHPSLPAGGAAVTLQACAPPHVTLSPEAKQAGVQALPLAEAGRDLVRLGQLVGADHGLFEAINAAVWSAGALVHVPRRARLTGPIHVLVPAIAATTLPRLLVVVDEQAEVTIIEEHTAGSSGSHVIGVSEVFLAAGAQLRYVLLQRWEPGVIGHLTLRAELQRDANLVTTLACFGGLRAKWDVGTRLVGPAAQSEMVGVVVGEGRQHLDMHTVQDHRVGHTWSNLDFKVALTGRARSVYTGQIRIEPHAAGSEAYQENRNLLLSDGCRADTIPELEILTDDVRCTHGATVAPVDPEHVFYLQSRGIPYDEALHVLVRGFLETTIRRIPQGLRDQIDVIVEDRLRHLRRTQR
jgi:Fe-S cluster assembly protein SufD